ncbi:PQQ-binding-like beta-propeller repeat protein [Streptomyces sp. NPDC058221]|uniref:protein kinase domain-containing protein n=1 Tax=Streptomyces sp. NPDC058221 TaxID=3346388 RepID=UPI0036E9BC31
MSDALLAGRYQLKRIVGRGGMGEVWEAFDERLGRTVAVKVVSLLAGGGSAAGELRTRFLREARITAALEHPRIVAVHDLGEAVTAEGSAPFLVMEFLRGTGLETVVRRGPVSGQEAARWGEQICDALAEAHAGGILHRDIKPANVFVTANGGVKVLDFGIARAADPAGAGDLLTRTGTVVGTAAYMAPEQARGRPEARSDLYAVGCLLFELLTGTLPFSAPDSLGHLTAHLNDTPPAPSAVLPGISAAWDELVLRLLEKEPARRCASAAELAGELSALYGHAGPAVPAPRRTPTVVDAGGPPAPDATTASVPQPPRSPKPPALTRRGALRWGAGAIAVGAAGTAAVRYLTQEPGKGPVAWSKKIDGAQKPDGGDPASAVSGGRWYMVTGTGPAVVHAFDAAQGKLVWKATCGPAKQGPRLAVAGPAVIVETRHPDEQSPKLQALDAAEGTSLWSRSLDSESSESWEVHQASGLVVVAGEKSVRGVDPRTGREQWHFLADERGDTLCVGDLVIIGGTALLGRTGKTVWERPGLVAGSTAHSLGQHILFYEAGKQGVTDLVCRSAQNGKVVWRTPFNEGEQLTGRDGPWEVSVSGTTVLLPLAAGGRRKPTAVDGATGKVKWTYDGPYRHATDYGDGELKQLAGVPRVLALAGVFLLPTDNGTVCLDAGTGRERWHSSDKGARRVGGYVLFTSSHDRLFTTWTRVRVLDARTGSEAWAGDFDTTPAAYLQPGDGRIFTADIEGTLWALRIREDGT